MSDDGARKPSRKVRPLPSGGYILRESNGYAVYDQAGKRLTGAIEPPKTKSANGKVAQALQTTVRTEEFQRLVSVYDRATQTITDARFYGDGKLTIDARIAQRSAVLKIESIIENVVKRTIESAIAETTAERLNAPPTPCEHKRNLVLFANGARIDSDLPTYHKCPCSEWRS